MPAAKLERSRKAIVQDFGDVLGEAETLLRQAAKETSVQVRLNAGRGLRALDRRILSPSLGLFGPANFQRRWRHRHHLGERH